jgi:hypothetical protein
MVHAHCMLDTRVQTHKYSECVTLIVKAPQYHVKRTYAACRVYASQCDTFSLKLGVRVLHTSCIPMCLSRVNIQQYVSQTADLTL